MSRPELFVFMALFAGWAGIAAWAISIGVRVNRLAAAARGSEAAAEAAARGSTT